MEREAREVMGSETQANVKAGKRLEGLLWEFDFSAKISPP